MRIIALAIMFIALMTSCSKESGTGKVTFYTLESSRYSLIVDDKEYGQIKRASQMPVCDDPLFQTISLTAGKHTIDAKSLDGYAWGSPKTITVTADQCVQVRLP